jgi:hypothetical protein
MFLLGPLLVLIFTLSQSIRDDYFGSVFQRLNFFLVILLAFSWSTVIFAATTVIRAPSDFTKSRAQRWPIAAANVTTAVAWTSFFFALTHVDPAIRNTIHSDGAAHSGHAYPQKRTSFSTVAMSALCQKRKSAT